MNKLNAKINRLFGISLAMSIGFPIGILCVVFGAINWIVPLFVVGILLVVAGFYIMPILWVQYAEKRGYRVVLRMIENEHIYTYVELSEQTGYNQKKVINIVKY